MATHSKSTANAVTIDRDNYGTLADGRKVERFVLAAPSGLTASILSFGSILEKVTMPDRDGRPGEITLGFDSLEGYIQNAPYLGATIGRVANRIDKGAFELDGQKYQMAANRGGHHLHGGEVGFSHRLWQAEAIEGGVRLGYHSPEGEEGYPGALDVAVVYTLSPDGTLEIRYEARNVGHKATPVNLTNHAYWNLAGDGTIRDHRIQLFCDRYLPVTEDLIPTGEARPVAGTDFDLRQPTELGPRIDAIGGIDHCFVIEGAEAGKLVPVARVEDPGTGRVLEIQSTEPAVQLYTGNFLDGAAEAGGHGKHTGFCLETQHYPNSPNQPAFPNTILRPGKTFTSRTIHRFSTV